ncbi:hypothetical protein GCM10027408_02030 [Microbacterium tumbae]
MEVSREFAAMGADELELRYVSADELRGIYGRRSAGLPSGHSTRAAVDDLLAALKTYGSTYVGTVGMERAGRIVSVWLTETTDAVLAVMSAEDHRQDRSA